MRLYKFIDAKYGLKSLAERRLKISRLDDQNDPFELFADSQANRAARYRVREERWAITREWGMLCFCEDWHSRCCGVTMLTSIMACASGSISIQAMHIRSNISMNGCRPAGSPPHQPTTRVHPMSLG